jgi:hypothetical protein
MNRGGDLTDNTIVFVYRIAWTFDGSRLVFKADNTIPGPENIWTVRVDGTDLRPIAYTNKGAAWALPLPQQTPEWVVQGYGDFPRLLIAAPGVDGSTLALYLVADDGATPVVQFDGLRAGHDSIVPQFSPDGKRIATRLYESWDGNSAVETVDIESGIGDARRVVVDQGAGDLSSERGAAFEEITGLAWLDDEHVVYSKRTTPSTAEFYAYWEKGIPLPVRGEVWLADLLYLRAALIIYLNSS